MKISTNVNIAFSTIGDCMTKTEDIILTTDKDNLIKSGFVNILIK